jgi:hypothetical protein
MKAATPVASRRAEASAAVTVNVPNAVNGAAETVAAQAVPQADLANVTSIGTRRSRLN